MKFLVFLPTISAHQNELPTSKTWSYHLNLRSNALLRPTTHGTTEPNLGLTNPSGQTQAQAHSILPTHPMWILHSILLHGFLSLSFAQLGRVPLVLSSLTWTPQRTPHQTTSRLLCLPILKRHPIGLPLQHQRLHKTSCYHPPIILPSFLLPPGGVTTNTKSQTEDDAVS